MKEQNKSANFTSDNENTHSILEVEKAKIASLNIDDMPNNLFSILMENKINDKYTYLKYDKKPFILKR